MSVRATLVGAAIGTFGALTIREGQVVIFSDADWAALSAAQQGLFEAVEAPGDETSASIVVTPVGGVAATNVQAAIAELDTEKQTAAQVATAVAVHSGDATDAHVASAIGVAAAGGIAADDLQAVLEALDVRIDALENP